MEKFQYLIVGMGLSLVLIGLLAGGVVGQNNNSTVENETTLPPQNGSDDYITMPIVNDTIEEPQDEVVEETELTPQEQIAIREGEKAEEAAMSGEEDTIEETYISPIETSEDTTINEPIEEEIKPAEEAENKPVATTEKQIFVKEKTTLRKTVSASGFVFVGTQYAGEEVEITVK